MGGPSTETAQHPAVELLALLSLQQTVSERAPDDVSLHPRASVTFLRNDKVEMKGTGASAGTRGRGKICGDSELGRYQESNKHTTSLRGSEGIPGLSAG